MNCDRPSQLLVSSTLESGFGMLGLDCATRAPLTYSEVVRPPPASALAALLSTTSARCCMEFAGSTGAAEASVTPPRGVTSEAQTAPGAGPPWGVRKTNHVPVPCMPAPLLLLPKSK